MMQKPTLKIIETLWELRALNEYLLDKEFVAYDTETTGVTQQDEVIGYSICAEEALSHYVILAKWDKTLQRLVYNNDLILESAHILNHLKLKSLLMHNGVFDCMLTEAYFKISLIEALHTDTMILAHLLNENRRIALKELGKSMYGQSAASEEAEMKASIIANGGSATKELYELYKADCYTIARYGAKDAWLTYKLFLDLVPELHAQKLDKFFYEDESMPLLKGPTYELNTTGILVDTKALQALKKTLEAECEEAKAYINQEIQVHIKDKYPNTTKKNIFNIDSPSQLSWLLFGKLEQEFGTLTKGGKLVCKALGLKLPYSPQAKRTFVAECLRRTGKIYQPEAIINGKKKRAKKFSEPWSYICSDKLTLNKLAPKYKWVAKLLEYQKKTKLLSTYVEGIGEKVRYGIIHPSFLQAGTVTGRYSSKQPNFQNLPRYDKRIKACMIARDGKVFVGADYSQLEPRVFAYYSGDKRLKEAFTDGTDFYSVIGMWVFGKTDCAPHKDGSPEAFGVKYKRLRDIAKAIALAATYGTTAYKLSSITGKSVDDTQTDMDRYFHSFSQVLELQLRSHKEIRKQGFVTNLFGRMRRVPEAMRLPNIPHGALPYEARKMLNTAINFKIQSTGASIVNRAAIRFYENCKRAGITDVKLVLQVHDSLVAECNEADKESVKVLLEDAMENTVLIGDVKLEAIAKISKNLAEV